MSTYAEYPLLGVLVSLLLISCSAPAAVPEGPWAENIRAAQAATTSDFEREAFADGVVTRAEYVEGLDRYVACMADVGWDVGLAQQGDYFVHTVSGADDTFDVLSDTCRAQTMGQVEQIYVDMLQNPSNQPFWVNVRECLTRGGLDVPPSGDELDALAQGLTDGTVTSEDPEIAKCGYDPT